MRERSKIARSKRALASSDDVGSGVATAVDPGASVTLTALGQYKTVVQTNGESSPEAVDQVNILSSNRLADESEISRDLFSHFDGIKYAPVIGYYHQLLAGHVKADNFRAEASSGGFASWILRELLRAGDIDGVVHVGEAPPGSEVLFSYVVSRTEDEIRSRSRSRYYPVELTNALHEIRTTPGRYAVVGIPSVISEVRLLSLVEPVFAERITFTIGLICGHQKSTRYAESMAWQAGITPGNLRAFDFRLKREVGMAWDYQMAMTGIIDGREVSVVRDQSGLFGSDWSLGFFKAGFSDFTDDALNETADVTVGDAWLSRYASDSQGTNVLIVRHPRIVELIEAGLRDQQIHIDDLSEADVLRSQRGLIHHTRDELPYRVRRAQRAGVSVPQTRMGSSRPVPIFKRLVQRTRLRMAAQSHLAYAEARRRGDWNYFERRMRPYVTWYRFLYSARGAINKLRGRQ